MTIYECLEPSPIDAAWRLRRHAAHLFIPVTETERYRIGEHGLSAYDVAAILRFETGADMTEIMISIMDIMPELFDEYWEEVKERARGLPIN